MNGDANELMDDRQRCPGKLSLNVTPEEVVMLQKANAELESRVAAGLRELASETRRSAQLHRRFSELAHNHQGLVVFNDEHKRHNVQLLAENKRLRAENDGLFSQELRDKETLIRQLQRDAHLHEEKHQAIGKDFKEKEAGLQSKLSELKSLQQTQEAALLENLRDTQRRLKAAEDVCEDLKQQLQQAADGHVLKEAEMKQTMKTLSAEKDNFMNLSMERGKIIQEKQETIQQLEMKLEEVEDLKATAENRFKQEAEAVNVNMKVVKLRRALDEAVKTNEKAREDFEAYKTHSANLLAQEKELNAKLRHMFA